MVSVHRVKFAPTIFFSLKEENCFIVYSKKNGNLLPEVMFLATKIEPEFEGGMNFLSFQLNKSIEARSINKIQ